MISPKPNISINVDVSNPGQFFACCGLLELADRLWKNAGVTASFSPPRFDRSHFRIFAKHPFEVRDIMKALLSSAITSVDSYRSIMGANGKPVKDSKKTKPVLILIKKSVSLRLSWWLDELMGRLTPFKMWGSHQTSGGLITDMVNEICVDEMNDQTVLESRKGMTGRIGFDIRSSWNALDEGFSPNDQNLPVDTYPATELLAAIGLETFRPAPLDNGYTYACWSFPLPTIITHAVVSDSVRIQSMTRYRFDIGIRGKFKFFTKASII